MDYYSHVSSDTLDRAKKIKLLLTDLDGVLTDGGILLDDLGMEYKKFQVKDGQIIPFLQEAGIKVGVLSGRDVAVSKKRCDQMKVDFHFHGVRDKWGTVAEILKRNNMSPAEVAYLGDDLIDLELLRKVGFSAAPADAMIYICDQVHYVTSRPGGRGSFRELADLILFAQGKLHAIISSTNDPPLSDRRF